MTDRLLRDALHRLAMDADAQRQALAGSVVTEELALDLDHAVQTVGGSVGPAVLGELQQLNSSFDAPPGDPLWRDAALDTHPVWAAARDTARRLLDQL